MRVVYMGTGEIGLPSLHWLLGNLDRFDLVGVYTQPDKPIGRKQILTPPAIKTIAIEAGIPVFQPEALRKNQSALDDFKTLEPDLAIVMAYGQILPKSLIEIPPKGIVNLHASLLPRHRGASPIQAAIREGDEESGITLMHIIPQLDAGDMIAKKSLPIAPEDTGGSLHDKLAQLGPELLSESFSLLEQPNLPREPQSENEATYAGKLEREDGRIDWSVPAKELERLIRAYDPWPGTFTEIQIGDTMRKLKVFPPSISKAGGSRSPGMILSCDDGIEVACGVGALRLEGDLQLEGRKRLPVAEFLKGLDLDSGTILGAPRD
ncbi:MAG: methionyl-tRNA formyltransferase [Verrucomicrobiota bacterium]